MSVRINEVTFSYQGRPICKLDGTELNQFFVYTENKKMSFFKVVTSVLDHRRREETDLAVSEGWNGVLVRSNTKRVVTCFTEIEMKFIETTES